MPNSILIVVASSGENEEYSQWQICATFDREKAEARIEEDKARRARFRDLSAQVAAFERRWHEENPYPSHAALLDIPKWAPGLGEHEITPEMRAERDRIYEHNTRVMNEFYPVREAHMDRLLEDIQRFMEVELRITDPEEQAMIEGGEWDGEVHYSIESLEFLD